MLCTAAPRPAAFRAARKSRTMVKNVKKQRGKDHVIQQIVVKIAVAAVRFARAQQNQDDDPDALDRPTPFPARPFRSAFPWRGKTSPSLAMA